MRKKDKLPAGLEMMSIFDFLDEIQEEAKVADEEPQEPEVPVVKGALELQNEAMEALLGESSERAYRKMRFEMLGADRHCVDQLADDEEILKKFAAGATYWQRNGMRFDIQKAECRVLSEYLDPRWKPYGKAIFDKLQFTSVTYLGMPFAVKAGNFDLVAKLANGEVDFTPENRTMYLLCESEEEIDAVKRLIKNHDRNQNWRDRSLFDGEYVGLIYLYRLCDREFDLADQVFTALLRGEDRYYKWQTTLKSEAAVKDAINQVRRYGNVVFLQNPGAYVQEEILQYRIMFPEEIAELVRENQYFNVETLKEAVLKRAATKEEKE